MVQFRIGYASRKLRHQDCQEDKARSRADSAQGSSSVVILRPHRRSEVFFLGLAVFGVEHSQLSTPGTPSLLAPDLGGNLFFRRFDSFKLSLDFIQQDSSSQKPIERLRALFLALDPDTGWSMVE